LWPPAQRRSDTGWTNLEQGLPDPDLCDAAVGDHSSLDSNQVTIRSHFK
jgi:hypothetical protein